MSFPVLVSISYMIDCVSRSVSIPPMAAPISSNDVVATMPPSTDGTPAAASAAAAPCVPPQYYHGPLPPAPVIPVAPDMMEPEVYTQAIVDAEVAASNGGITIHDLLDLKEVHCVIHLTIHCMYAYHCFNDL